MRDFIAILLVPFMKITGYRFSKYHRQNETLVYKMVNVVSANIKSGL